MNKPCRMTLTTAPTGLLFTLPNLTALRADVKPAALFGDHMVLQQGMSVPVWGWADPGEQVTVSIAGQKQSTTAGADRKWMVRLTNLRASSDPVEMTIAGKNTIRTVDILIGEVWFGSGQSNMDFVVSGDMAKYPGMAQRFAGVANEAEEIAAANCPKVREFRVPLKTSELPLEDVVGKWQVCTPATVPGFSAIGYFFSRNLQKAINQPIGFITSAFGASCAQAWVSKDVLESDARLKGIMDGFATQVAAFKSAAADNPAPPAGARGGRGNPLTNQHNPYVLWNAMIKPIQPYAIKGVLWYQGESITEGLQLYPVVMEHVITSWRRQWGQGEFPFYFVQLAAQDAASNRPEVREAQAQALKVPNTAMAVAMDIGEKKNVHPKNKQNLCDRLARIARANVYGEKIEYLWSDVRFDRRGRPIDPRQVHACRRRIGRQGRRPQAVPNCRRRQELRGCCREGRWQYDCGDRPRRPGARRRSLCVASLAGRREPLQRGRLAGAAVPIRRLGVPRTGSCRGRRGRGPGVVRATPPPCIVGISWGAGSSVAQPTVAQPRTVESDRRALPRYAPVIFSVIAKSQGFAGGICTFRPSASCAHCSLP